MKEKFKKIIEFLFNPKMLFCFAIAWLITNGWSYIMFFLGTFFNINWMIIVSGTYLAFLWLPISPEKIVTVTIAIYLLKVFFPYDVKTLGVLKELHIKTKNVFKNCRKKKDNEKE